MNQAGQRDAHGSTGGTDRSTSGSAGEAGDTSAQARPAADARPRTGAARVPPQQGATDADREREGGRQDTSRDAAARSDSARGEHTHSEIPIPSPRAAAPRPVVQRSSVRGQILDALRVALMGGELAPGEVYSAPLLGERFGVSATPVREAMQQLAVEGAVEVVPNRGFRVVERGARELAELAEIRVLLEAPVMQRLARSVPAERWAELRPLAEATARAASTGCRATYVESDRAFHRAVLALSGNEQLVRIADDLHRRAQWPLVTGPASRRRAALTANAAEHAALLSALIDRDLAMTQSLVRDHFTCT